MLDLALRAGLPLVSVRHRDTVNLARVLTHHCPGIQNTQGMGEATLAATMERGHWFTLLNELSADQPFDHWIRHRAETEGTGTMIVVNPPRSHPALFDAGELEVPEALIRESVAAWHSDEIATRVMPALHGLTLLEAYRALSLAKAEDPDLPVHAVARMRRAVFGMPAGLELVETEYLHYRPSEGVMSWTEDARALLGLSLPRELWPRGFALTGPPGTGKTMAAKYVAASVGVPLYKLAVGASLSKWLGESERNLAEALAAVDRLSPCVLLIDEAEKLFRGDEDSGAPKRMLADLLWWMQERSARVLVVLTTNDVEALPPELVRDQRVDAVIELEPLTHIAQVAEFIVHECEALGLAHEKAHEIKDAIMAADLANPPVSQARASQATRDYMKRRIIGGNR